MHETDPLRVALIVGSTRADRFADLPVQWMTDGIMARDDLTLDVLDLRDYQLPFYGEADASDERAQLAIATWRRHIARADAYIVTAAEYNHAPTAVLKNALDHANSEWHRKPIAFIGYGGLGGARAVEHLRHIAIELQMAPIKTAIHIAADVFTEVRERRARLTDFPHLEHGRDAMLDQLVFWGGALRAARAAHGLATAAAG